MKDRERNLGGRLLSWNGLLSTLRPCRQERGGRARDEGPGTQSCQPVAELERAAEHAAPMQAGAGRAGTR